MDLNGALWRKSTRSGNNGGDCVEIADVDHLIAVRDSKNPDGPKLTLARTAWHELMLGAKEGRFDL